MHRYQLVRTSQYLRELEAIDADTERLERALDENIYWVLEWKPQEGWPIRETNLWYLRRRLYLGIILVDVYYRIHEEQQEVELVSIRAIDPRRM